MENQKNSVQLTDVQMEVGAKYMAVSNMGMEDNFGVRHKKGIKSRYTIAQVESGFEATANDFYGETGDSECMNVEMKSWLKDIKAGNEYCLTTILEAVIFENNIEDISFRNTKNS